MSGGSDGEPAASKSDICSAISGFFLTLFRFGSNVPPPSSPEMSVSPPPSTLSTMKTFPIEKYKLGDILGQGAYGIVSLYKRKDGKEEENLPQKVAVKMFLSKDADNFSTELQHLAKVYATNPPNIVRCYGSCQLQKGKLGLVMELFDCDLMEYLSSPCSVSESSVILKQIARALKCLHTMEIVHRDIKPENILVKKAAIAANGDPRIALTDMGVSKHMTRTQARRQTRGKGTDLWMAPEVEDTVAKGEQPTYGHPIDVFGFGLTAVFILTRREWLGRLGRKIDASELNNWVEECLTEQGVVDSNVRSLIKESLEFDPTKRIRKENLLNHAFFRQLSKHDPPQCVKGNASTTSL